MNFVNYRTVLSVIFDFKIIPGNKAIDELVYDFREESLHNLDS